MKLAIFSRNGIPAIRIGNARQFFIRNYDEFSQLSDDLRAAATGMRTSMVPEQGRDRYAGVDTQQGASSFSTSNAEWSDAVQNLVPTCSLFRTPPTFMGFSYMNVE